MPFAMIHLNIAMEVLREYTDIQKPGDFLLGALAPDAVHYRKNYDSSMKFNSHLCLGDEAWGSVTNNNEWEAHVKDVLKSCHDKDDRDFMYGYICHILADIQNNRKVWMPFKEQIKGSTDPNSGKKYHVESNHLDYVLYLNSDPVLWHHLDESIAYSMFDLVSEEEVTQLKKDLVNNRFKNRIAMDLSKHEYVHLNEMEKFIKEEGQFILDIFNSVKGAS